MNNLFNDKLLVKKANEEVDLSKHNLSERRQYLNKWIDMLENGVLDKTKEEQLQGEFISDIFSKLLNAKNITDGQREWNLERETKTNLDGQKADGTLGFFNKDGKKDIRALIELKGANINLDARQKRVGDTRSAVEQAFGYAPKYGANCQWIIVSNFKEIRLYKSNSMLEYQVFFLEKLRDDLEFKKFIYLLSFYALVGTEKKKAKTLELSEEYQKEQSEIEKKFYNEYKQIRLNIYENMKKNNPNVSEITIIEKVQKLLDRFLFICFCEDKDLIPENSYRNLVVKGENLGDISDMFNMFCHWIDTGNKKNNIPHFNGGLFRSDSDLENLTIDNEVFQKMQGIADYDFDSELNETILGHIFEQSISDIEELKKLAAGEEFDKKDSKRKKDGIFYTPKYVTRYIVENTIGSWIEDKKKELGEDKLPELEEKDYVRKTHNKVQKYTTNYQLHINFWEKLQVTLKNIKVVDPACGSGAFLIEAFDYLLKYNQFLDDKLFELKGTKDLFSDSIKNILENNIFGVDLNKESIEITKLSLWLRTANKNKTLTTLENNIKCGNSLISDKEVAGESAFNWEEEFPLVFKDGGFDVVVGNPPYFNIQTMGANSTVAKYLQENYSDIYQDKSDIIFYFIYRALKITKSKVGFIVSNAFLFSDKARKLRNYLLEESNINKITNFEKYLIFNEASITTAIIELDKNKTKNKTLAYSFKEKKYDISTITQKLINSEDYFEVNLKKDTVYALVDKKINYLNEKIDGSYKKINELLKIGKGMETAANKQFIFSEYPNQFPKEFVKKRMSGEIINKYGIGNTKEYVLYFENIESFEELPESIQKHLTENKEFLENRATVKNEGRIWWRYSRPMHKQYYHLNKLWCSYRAKENIFCFDATREYIGMTNTTVIFDTNKEINLWYVCCLLNSKALTFRYRSIGKQTGSGVFEYFENGVGKLPIPNISADKQTPFIEKANIMIELNEKFQKKINKFESRLLSNLELQKTTKKLDAFYDLTFKDLLKELKKQKITLSLSEQDEWEEYFEGYKKDIIELKQEIAKLDDIINNMVYKLYDLTDEEIKVIEENISY